MWLTDALGGRRRDRRAAEDTRTVEVGEGMAVVYTREGDVVSERYVGIRGTPSRVVRDVAAERLTRRQLEAGEDPWFPEVAARLGQHKPPAHDDAAPA
ncbi:hypothetical protein [Actinotalea sp. Marseille-Q4924]|uniref:hypothetical protein n=1 Tax=Actinotalea sp. Marseille-Q4924 TaxID=2866571 RepID=UPI001CE4A73F|nr:hypothetical protein [Actinotalea sp. Marseille-Q4924]